MRSFFYIMMGCVLFADGLFFVPQASADDSKLTIPIIKYRGGNYKPRPEAVRSLMAQLASRTSIEVNREVVEIELTDPDLYRYPFIYMAGNAAFDPFNKKELRILRHYLGFGGFLLIDDNSSKANSGFDASVRELMSRLFPKIPLQKINRDHSIYRSFYLINRAVGRVVVNPFFEGISVKGRTVLVYSTNDLGGAWARDKLGHWSYDIIAGGTAQRQGSIRLAVNIVMYSLTLDYKKDMVHLPIILERLRRHPSK
ncbi:MAG: DUF4159 domain-containing protein [Nitrospinae bacterium]|jgi:hypothetical protein|nr:DUF4159 domain-containing protein [Nitrospinota bacterium]MDA1108966.1 DUF4159 domain-containing protein [Nitrospinota bacterium]